MFFEESTTSLGSESTADLQSRSSSLQNIIATESHNELNQGRSRILSLDFVIILIYRYLLLLFSVLLYIDQIVLKSIHKGFF